MIDKEQFKLDSAKLKEDREEILKQIRKVQRDSRIEVKRLQANLDDLGNLKKGNRAERPKAKAARSAANAASLTIQLYLHNNPKRKNVPETVLLKAAKDACKGTIAERKTVERHLRDKIPYMRVRSLKTLQAYSKK